MAAEIVKRLSFNDHTGDLSQGMADIHQAVEDLRR
jgi:hypothetical protein